MCLNGSFITLGKTQTVFTHVFSTLPVQFMDRRLADEIADTFHDFDKSGLLNRSRAETYRHKKRVGLDSILQSFQQVVHQYKIREMLNKRIPEKHGNDLHKRVHFKLSQLCSFKSLQKFESSHLAEISGF